MKILHTADWHLGAPLSGHSEQVSQYLRQQLQKVPEKIAQVCRQENCDMMLIAGDLFDGSIGREAVTQVQKILGELQIPVIITPGNHDFCSGDSPYFREDWPENVHIFTHSQIESIVFPALDCKIYGAGYQAMDCPSLLKHFRAEGNERWHIGVLHAEVGTNSMYSPITKHQIQESGLDYLALGHIHKQGSQPAGETVCLWPGCPMGRGFDELGVKGVFITEFNEGIRPTFVPLDTPRFYEEETDASNDAAAAIRRIVPATESQDFYRIILTGYSHDLDIADLLAQFPHLPNLTLQDQTVPETDLWINAGDDTLEGHVFSHLKELADSDNDVLSQRAALAARICRQILDGQEVKLP